MAICLEAYNISIERKEYSRIERKETVTKIIEKKLT